MKSAFSLTACSAANGTLVKSLFLTNVEAQYKTHDYQESNWMRKVKTNRKIPILRICHHHLLFI
jgi:hypothetical protein